MGYFCITIKAAARSTGSCINGGCFGVGFCVAICFKIKFAFLKKKKKKERTEVQQLSWDTAPLFFPLKHLWLKKRRGKGNKKQTLKAAHCKGKNTERKM